MRKFSLPLQLLLTLALILNGIGGAMAGVLAAVPAGMMPASAAAAGGHPAGHGAMTQIHEASAEAPVANASVQQPDDCGGHQEAAAETMAAQAAPSDCHTGGDDCGGSAECRQACLHASVAVPPQLQIGIAQARAETSLHPLANGHPAPALRGLIRPPIA